MKKITDNFITGGFESVAFAINSLSANQMSYCCIQNINKWLKENFGVNFSIFYQENAIPCKSLNFARFHIKDCEAFTGDLISTCFGTANSIKNATRSRRYYYISDLEWRRPWFKFSASEVNDVLFNKDIKKFTRSKDYYDELTSMNIEVSDIIVPDFNIEQILEITRNG